MGPARHLARRGRGHRNAQPDGHQEVPASVSLVTSKEIQNTSAQELDDVLRIAPGVDVLGY